MSRKSKRRREFGDSKGTLCHSWRAALSAEASRARGAVECSGAWRCVECIASWARFRMMRLRSSAEMLVELGGGGRVFGSPATLSPLYSRERADGC